MSVKSALHVGRTLKLVWRIAPGWTAAQVALAVVQGLLPVVALFLYRAIVNAATAGGSAADKEAAFRHVAYLILWAALVGLAIVLARSVTSLSARRRRRS